MDEFTGGRLCGNGRSASPDAHESWTCATYARRPIAKETSKSTSFRKVQRAPETPLTHRRTLAPETSGFQLGSATPRSHRGSS